MSNRSSPVRASSAASSAVSRSTSTVASPRSARAPATCRLRGLRRPGRVAPIVSRGGRPDLAGDALEAVDAPTLLLVGGEDHQVLALNRAAQRRLRVASRLEIVPGAGHLFEEPGALDAVARLAADWFVAHLGRRSAAAGPSDR